MSRTGTTGTRTCLSVQLGDLTTVVQSVRPLDLRNIRDHSVYSSSMSPTGVPIPKSPGTHSLPNSSEEIKNSRSITLNVGKLDIELPKVISVVYGV